MSYCTKCGKLLNENANFCANCGSPVVVAENAAVSLDVTISAQVTLKGKLEESTAVDIYFTHIGKTMSVRVPNNIQIGQSLRLRGLGHTAEDGRKGDAYVRIVQIDYDNTNQGNENPRRKTSYEGEVRKCPQCRETINAFVPVCPSCGHEFRGSSATSVVHQLAVKLEKTNDSQKRDELIRDFHIPNTREDILEFFILALSNIKTGGMNTNAWMVKLEQAYQKAELTFSDTYEFERLKPMYEKARKMNGRNSTVSILARVAKLFRSGYAWAILSAMFGLVFLLIYAITDEEMIGTLGLGGFAVGMWIGLMTMQHKEDKKNGT